MIVAQRETSNDESKENGDEKTELEEEEEEKVEEGEEGEGFSLIASASYAPNNSINGRPT